MPLTDDGCLMKRTTVVWLASYPRSGNTLLRTILWHCFELRSASIYPNDLGQNKQLEDYVGHLEHGNDGKTIFPVTSIPLVKTHGHPPDSQPAIYVVRDGRVATLSLWNFYNRTVSLETIIAGQHPFGTWSSHISAWNPHKRPNTLLLKYEDMVIDLPNTLKKLSDFLERDIIQTKIPARTTIAQVDGTFVTQPTNHQVDLPTPLKEMFNRLNEDSLKLMGYLP